MCVYKFNFSLIQVSQNKFAYVVINHPSPCSLMFVIISKELALSPTKVLAYTFNETLIIITK